MRIVLIFIGIMALVSGVKFIYDARPIAKKYFGFGDKNEATLGLKLFGFVFTLVGGLLLYYNF